MAKASDNRFPKVILTEQGSTPSSPSAGDQKLFIDSADHKLKRVDSAGSVTTIEGGGGGIDSGTSFPGSPTTNDLYFRTDRGLLYFYDGTRWLTVTLYEHYLGDFFNASSNLGCYTAVWEDNYDVYVVDYIATLFASGLSGTAYWRMDLYFWDGGTQGSAVATVNNQSGTSSVFARKKVSMNSLMGTSIDAISCELFKVSTPGNFYGGAFLTYRLVG